MLALILAAALGATAPEGTVFTQDGGRIRGFLVESGPDGVTLRLADGSFRRFSQAQVQRVVLADGSQWRPGLLPTKARPATGAAAPALAGEPVEPASVLEEAAAPVPPHERAADAPAPPPVTPQVALAAPAPAPPSAPDPTPIVVPLDRLDTVFLAGGGRVRGLVTEATRDGVVLRLVDGRERRFAPVEVERVAWAGEPAGSTPEVR
jgi:hypothetical protein